MSEGLPPETPRTGRRWDLFVWGAAAWVGFNVLVWFLLSLPSAAAGSAGAIALVLNLLWLGYFGVKRPWFALGALGCIGGVLAVVAVVWIFVLVTCGSRFG